MNDKFEVGKHYTLRECNICTLEIVKATKNNDIIWINKTKIIKKCNDHDFYRDESNAMTPHKWYKVATLQDIWIELESMLERDVFQAPNEI